jgi:hypothetical protein
MVATAGHGIGAADGSGLSAADRGGMVPRWGVARGQRPGVA